MPGLLAVSTLCREEGDILYLSRDYGENWEVTMFDLSIGNLHFETSYMKPEYNSRFRVGIPYIGRIPASAKSCAVSAVAIFSLRIADTILLALIRISRSALLKER